ncbi:hypothetical protein, partial [Natrinema salifodinae]
MSTPYQASTSDRPTYPAVEDRFGEDPARFLSLDELYLAEARIKCIDDLEYLREWQRIEAEEWGRSNVMKWLNARERELTGESVTPEPDPTPVPATDGGTELEYDEDAPVNNPDDTAIAADDLQTTAESGDATSDSSTPDSASRSDDLHPDVKGLDAGQVLILERAEPTEYIFPATPEANAPYLLRTAADETAEPLTFDAVLAR